MFIILLLETFCHKGLQQSQQKYSVLLRIPHKRSGCTSHRVHRQRTDSLGQWEEMPWRVSGAGGPRSTDANNVFASEQAEQVSHADS